jgi:hypothetical protein
MIQWVATKALRTLKDGSMMARHRSRIVYLVAWLVALGGTLRYLGYILSHPGRWAILGLLAAFFVLLALVPWLSRRPKRYMHLCFALQTCILVALTVVTTIEDFAALPFMALILIAMTVFPPRIGFRWIAAFTNGCQLHLSISR